MYSKSQNPVRINKRVFVSFFVTPCISVEMLRTTYHSRCFLTCISWVVLIFLLWLCNSEKAQCRKMLSKTLSEAIPNLPSIENCKFIEVEVEITRLLSRFPSNMVKFECPRSFRVRYTSIFNISLSVSSQESFNKQSHHWYTLKPDVYLLFQILQSSIRRPLENSFVRK